VRKRRESQIWKRREREKHRLINRLQGQVRLLAGPGQAKKIAFDRPMLKLKKNS
jgi:hypothetical protein